MFGMNQGMLFLHLLAALWLAGAAFGGTIVRAQMRRATDLRAKVEGLRTLRRLMMVMGLPGSILAGLVGIELVRRMEISYSTGWVAASIVIWALSVVMTLFFLGPRLRRTLAAGEASLAAGAATAEFQALGASRLPSILADFNALVIVLLTFLMVFKPF
jgi:uncharacterized membrane protein